MSVVAELRELGHLGGPATLDLLERVWVSCVREFYVLAPDGWTRAAREDLLAEFLSLKIADLTEAVVPVGNEASVAKVMKRIMRNWLVDQARKTDLGAVRLRLEELLRDGEHFHRPVPGDHRWALAGHAGPSFATEADLLEVAWAVPGVRSVRWRDAKRRPPMASGPDLVRVMTAVLTAAAGSVETATLVGVFRRRFAVVLTTFVSLEAVSGSGRGGSGGSAASPAPGALASAAHAGDGRSGAIRQGLVAAPDPDPVELAAAGELAAAVFAQLSDRERRVLTIMGDIERVQQVLSVGRSVAYLTVQRLTATLAALAGKDVDHEALVAELVRLADRIWPDDPCVATSGAPASMKPSGGATA